MSIILGNSLETISIDQVSRGPLALGSFLVCFLAGKKSRLQSTTEKNLLTAGGSSAHSREGGKSDFVDRTLAE
jgi:hypothetical protein